MTVDDFISQTDHIRDRAKKDNDCYVFCYFSREEDKFIGEHRMDAGDAMIVINRLITDFGLDPEAIALMRQ